MDAVLGLSVTPSSVGVVLVEGPVDDGATLDGESFDVGGRGRRTPLETSEKAAAALLRTEAVAADLGRRVQSIGVTWSDDADAEARLLLTSLRESGYDNVVPVRLSEATDALARRIAHVLGYDTTAVCVIEPGALIALIVTLDERADGPDSVQTAVNHAVVTEDDLVGWLSTVFARADWEPEALVLVGSAEDLDGLLPVLEDALDVPVFSPNEAQLALARGAALACTRPAEFDPTGFRIGATVPERAPLRRPARRRDARTVAAVMLAAGAVTFVASVSAAVAIHLTPDAPAPDVVSESVTPAPAPIVEAPTTPARVPAVEAPAPTVETPVETPAEAPIVDVPVPAVAEPVAEAPAVDTAAPDPAPPDALPPPPSDGPPQVAPPPIPAAPQERPGILQRIRDRLSGINSPDPGVADPGLAGEPAAPVAPPPVPPVLPMP